MKKVPGILLILASCSVAQIQDAGETGDLGTAWDKVLDCGLARTAECKRVVRDLAGDESSPAHIVRLASIVLEEWEEAPNAQRLKRPREVSIPLPPMEKLREHLPESFEYSFVLVSFTVEADGGVANVRVQRPSKYGALNEKLHGVFMRARFRPARDDQGYVSFDSNYTFHIEPRG